MPEPGSFGALLRQDRVAAGLSQEQLAKQAGLRRGIADLERGARRMPFPSTVRRLAEALNLSPRQRAALLAAARPVSAGAPDRRTADPFRLPLWVPSTSFVGRQRQLEDVRQLLAHSRLLTLTGTGGSGKTRLALEAGRARLANHADGVVLVSLAPVADHLLVARTIAQGLGVREISERPLRDTLIAYLRPRDLLLLLDNFEHLLEAAPLVSDLLAACPKLAVLATSREALRLREEQEYLVPPLELPPAARDAPVAALIGCASVELFGQRAAQVAPGFTVTPERARTIADVCLRLDGLPLAIELAAARTRILSLGLLLERLEHRLPLLVGGARDLPARQRTLRATIAWSHDLLSAGDQRLFRRLAVFVGGCTLEAAEGLCREDADLDLSVLDGLTSLVNKNLLRRDEGPDDEMRFTMLESVREFALEQLEASGELDAFRARHASLFARLAEEWEPFLYGRERTRWSDRLHADQENIGAALRWSVEHQCPESGLAIAGALWIWHWLSFREGRASVEAVLRLPGADAPSTRRAKALFMASLMAWGEGDGPAFEGFGREGVAVSRAIGSPERLAYALSIYATNRAGALDGLHAHYAECLEAAAHAAGAPWLVGWVHMCYAVAAAQLGEPETACREGREAVERFRHLGDVWLQAISAMPLCMGLLQLGRLEGAEAVLREALPVFRQVGDPKWLDTSLLGVGLVARQRGHVDEMARSYSEALLLCRDAGDTGNAPLALEGLAATSAARREWGLAARLLGAAEAARSLGGQPTIPDYQQLYQATAATVRAALEESAFSEAWKAGRQMGLDEAVTEARLLATARPAPSPGVAARAARLSSREQEVLRLLAGGCTSREIAAALVLSSHTVERHVANLYAKIGARRRADAVAYALQHGLFDGPVA